MRQPVQVKDENSLDQCWCKWKRKYRYETSFGVTDTITCRHGVEGIKELNMTPMFLT